MLLGLSTRTESVDAMATPLARAAVGYGRNDAQRAKVS